MRQRGPQAIDVKTIDMTPSGEFVSPPPGSGSTPAPSIWPLKLAFGAATIAVVAGAVALAAIFLWVASLLIPVAIVGGAIAYGAFRYQQWRNHR
jgi:hypothetical protein